MFRDVLKLNPLLQKIATQKIKENEKKHFDAKKSPFTTKKYGYRFIQTIQNYQLRKKFRFKHIKENELQDYRAFFTGNAPEITGLELYKQKDKQIALIALSGMRGLLLACQLGCKEKIPKIFLVENSRQVCALWYKLREFAFANKTEKLFLENIIPFLKENQHLFLKNSYAAVFFQALFDNYDFEYVRSILCKTSIIKQNWSDQTTFFKLRNYISYLKIDVVYAFPSNIISLQVNKNNQGAILKNISIPKPFLSIYTNLNPQTKKPDKVFLIDEKQAEHTKEMIFNNQWCTIL